MDNNEVLKIYKSQFMLSKKGLEMSTFNTYMYEINDMIKYLNNKSLTEVSNEDVEGYLMHSILDAKNKKRTYNVKLSAIRGLYNMLATSSQLNHIENPTTGIEFYMIKDRDVKVKNPLTKEEEMLMLKNANIRQRAMIALMLSNGLRISEVVNLTLEQYNQMEDDTIFLTETKGKKHRYAVIPKYVQNIINQYIETRNSDSKYLFTTCHGNKVDKSNMITQLRGIAKKSGFNKDRVKEINNHLFRHTCANDLLNKQDVPIDIVQEVLGHSSIVTTRMYAKTSVNRVKDVMKNRQLLNV